MNSFSHTIELILLAILFLVLFNKKEKLTFYIEPFPGTESLLKYSKAEMTKTESNEIREKNLKWCKSSKEGINDRLKKASKK